MDSTDLVGFDMAILAENATPKQLKELRANLYAEMAQGFTDDDIELVQPRETRDPATIGALAVILLPVLVDKLCDLVIDWAKKHDECSITIRVPIENAEPLEITYNPNYVSDAKVREWLANAAETAQASAR